MNPPRRSRPSDGLVSEQWILAQPAARLRYPGSVTISADSGGESPEVPGDPMNTAAYRRAFLRAPARREEVVGWYGAELEREGWTLVVAPPAHPYHWHRFRRGREAFSLFLYDRSPFASDGQGLPGPSSFSEPGTVHQVFYEARAVGFSD